MEFIIECRKNKMSWTAIASHHGVSVRTLFRWRDKTEFQEPLENGTRESVLPLVTKYMRDQPQRGEQSFLAHLRSVPNFIWISLLNLRELINEVDPEGREKRKKKCINRRVYSAPGSGYVHHIDTHHKLGRWGIVMMLFILVFDDSWADGSNFAGEVFSFEFKDACLSKITISFASEAENPNANRALISSARDTILAEE